jgi:hypothetical protein
LKDLSAWLNGATAFVAVWYDQSGSGKVATTSSSNQPILEYFQQKWMVRFNGTNQRLGFSDINVLGVFMQFYALNYTNSFGTIIGRAQADRSFRFLNSRGTANVGDWLYLTDAKYSKNNETLNNTTDRPGIALNTWYAITGSRSTSYGFLMNEIGRGSWSGGDRGLNGYIVELIMTSTANAYENIHNEFYAHRFMQL